MQLSLLLNVVYFQKKLTMEVLLAEFSYADLEANYQGLKFALDMCEGSNPLLVQDSNGKWSQRKDFDITPYLNPKWDESYYPSAYIKKKMEAEGKTQSNGYCDKRFSPKKVARFQYYRSIDKDTLSSIYT